MPDLVQYPQPATQRDGTGVLIRARDNGIKRLQADVLPGNRHMLDIFRHSGVKIKRQPRRA